MNASICSYQTIELGPQHQGDVARLLLDLDPASRVSRFNCAVCDAVLIRHSQQALMATCWLAGIFIGDDLRGIVEAYEMNPHGLIELAFLVDRTWRRRRLGTALLEAAVQWAAESDRVLLRMVFSSQQLADAKAREQRPRWAGPGRRSGGSRHPDRARRTLKRTHVRDSTLKCRTGFS